MSVSILPEKFEQPALPHISIVAPPNFYFPENGTAASKKQEDNEEECGEDQGNAKGLGWFVASLFVVST